MLCTRSVHSAPRLGCGVSIGAPYTTAVTLPTRAGTKAPHLLGRVPEFSRRPQRTVGAIGPVQNLYNTTIPARMARPVAPYMKSMDSTTRLGPGAGIDALSRFPVRRHRPLPSAVRPSRPPAHPRPRVDSPRPAPAIHSATRIHPSGQSPRQTPAPSRVSSTRRCRRRGQAAAAAAGPRVPERAPPAQAAAGPRAGAAPRRRRPLPRSRRRGVPQTARARSSRA